MSLKQAGALVRSLTNPFSVSPKLLERIRRQWLADPVHKSIVMHRRADLDEIVARVLAATTKEGRQLLPGIELANEVEFTDSPTDFLDQPEGRLFLGVGGEAGFDEHALPAQFQGRICCATFVATALGIEKDPRCLPIIRASELDDLYARAKFDSLAQIIKRAYRVGAKNEEVVHWATSAIVEWHQVLSGTQEQPLNSPTLVPYMQDYRQSVKNMLAGVNSQTTIQKRLTSMQNLFSPDQHHNEDSLAKMAARGHSLHLRENDEVSGWCHSMIANIYVDLVASAPETMIPELSRAAVVYQTQVDDRQVNVVFIDLSKMTNALLAEHAAKFCRWSKDYNAAVVIQRTAKGSTQIFANEKLGVNLEAVAAKLLEAEPERWKFIYGSVLNGSLKHNLTPSSFSINELVDLVKQFAKYG
jgi:hypothetical protein